MRAPKPHHRIRVCLWAPLPPPDGGISRWTLRYCQEAEKYGLDVSVIDTAPRTKQFSERSRFSIGRSLHAIRVLRRLWEVLREDKPDVCHITTTLFWATPRDAFAIWLCQACGVPTVLNIRASSQIVAWREQLGSLRRRLLDAVLRSADVVAVLSAELKSYLERTIPGHPIILIPNMVGETELSSLVETADLVLPPRSTLYRILFVGFMTPLKGLGDLAGVLLDIDNCELVVVGGPGGAMDTEQASVMERSLQKLREENRLIGTGPLEPHLVTRVYREVDIFVLPSYREGLPNVLLEAMAAGLPCVATPVGAITDVLQDSCGIMIPVGDRKQLRTAIVTLLGDASLRANLGAKARRRISDSYTADNVMGAYQALYTRLSH